MNIMGMKERGGGRERETERDRDRDRQTDRNRETETDRQRQTDRDRDRAHDEWFLVKLSLKISVYNLVFLWLATKRCSHCLE